MASNPWDVPPAPERGDAHEDITFAAIGRALTGWEQFETQLAEIFALLVGSSHDTAMAAFRAYGSVISFKGRACLVGAAAKVFFNAEKDETGPRMELGKDFVAFMNQTERYSGRRNEIAHGIVKHFQGGGGGFALYPTSYMTNKNELMSPLWQQIFEPLISTPKYVYTSPELIHFTHEFVGLAKRGKELRSRLAKLPTPSP